jgi:phosphatidylinositol-3-phosphatase
MSIVPRLPLKALRARRAAFATGAIAVACGLVAHGAASSTTGVRAVRPSASAPCGARGAPPARYDHVIWITFENQSAKHVIGNRGLPFVNRIARRCGLATNFFAEAHPSLPNYIAMTSGGTQGVTGDSSGPLAADNIYAQVKRSGRQWRHYAFGMPSNCDHADAPSSNRAIYTAHHQPPIFYRSVAADCARWDVGVGDPAKVEDRSDVRTGPLADALRRNRLPAFATIEPTDDGGNSKAGGEVDPVKGDAFLARWIPRITSSSAYRRGRTAIFVTWDEPDDFGTDPPRDTIATIVIAPTVPAGTKVATRFDHYAMLRTTEELLGLSPFLGAAANAPSMRRGFRF